MIRLKSQLNKGTKTILKNVYSKSQKPRELFVEFNVMSKNIIAKCIQRIFKLNDWQRVAHVRN